MLLEQEEEAALHSKGGRSGSVCEQGWGLVGWLRREGGTLQAAGVARRSCHGFSVSHFNLWNREQKHAKTRETER